MKQKTEKIVKNNVFTRDFKVDGPRTRSSIKQEIEYSKESMRCALYSPVKVEPSSLKIGKGTNSNSTETLQFLSEGMRKRHCSICNVTFSNRDIYFNHEIHFHNTKETPIFDSETLYCNICRKTYKSHSGYRRHMSSLNNIHTSTTRKLVPDPLKEPDPKDPNNHCLSCNFTFRDRGLYRHHLLIRHDIPRIAGSKELKNVKDSPPIIDMENLYCDVCNKIYDIKGIYISHLVRIHRMVLPDIYSEQENFDPENNYCKLCDIKYKSKSSFRAHLKNIHHTELPLRPPLSPSTNDKNNYCIVCDKKFYSKSHYLSHIARIHHTEDLDLFKGVDCAKPSKGDMYYNRYCSDCHKVFMTKMFSQIHSDRIHGIKPHEQPKKPKSLPSVGDPDVNDPNNHCSLCNTTYIHRRGYRTHLVQFHNLILPGSRADISDTAPVVDLLKNYCDVCDRRYASLRSYRLHMSKRHERPQTRAYIKQETEDSKEYSRRALYSPVKSVSSTLEISECENSDSTKTLRCKC
ncbi:hypothetical protein INT48_003930 [Thamnidium elegans]|uniref:C2H2-type domain-containing protein n=1 Tax=Thamnidium elegans TaxID=101142 RepID=A0A8H7SWQ7_9FUNG|nr:hypothetical protein INT48_003930 [Thamnidium elegans]